MKIFSNLFGRIRKKEENVYAQKIKLKILARIYQITENEIW